MHRIKVCIVELQELISTRRTIYTFKFVFPYTFMEEIFCELNIQMKVHLFSGKSYFGTAWINGCRRIASLEVQRSNLVDSHNNLIHLTLVGIVGVAHYCRICFAVCRFSLNIVSSKVAFRKGVIKTRCKRYRANRKQLSCYPIARICKVCHAHIAKVSIRLPSFHDSRLNITVCYLFVSHNLFPPYAVGLYPALIS